MSYYTALLDANVLFPAPIRDLFLQLAVRDLFRAKWSPDIHREWIDAVLRTQPQRDHSALERTRDLVTFSPTNLAVWWGLLHLADWSLLLQKLSILFRLHSLYR